MPLTTLLTHLIHPLPPLTQRHCPDRADDARGLRVHVRGPDGEDPRRQRIVRAVQTVPQLAQTQERLHRR